MKKKYWITVGISLLLLFSISSRADDSHIYSHFTLVEGEVYIFKSNQDEAKQAVINHPLVQGDIVYTNGNGRCELQFNNGTVMRLNHHTELQLTTVLIPSLTTNKKITTLHLNKGQVFSMNQTYNREVFQLITPTASVKLTSRSTHSVSIDKDGNTHVFTIRGKVEVMYDEKDQTPKAEIIRAGKGYRFNANQMNPDPKTADMDFMLWNEKINNNFKEFHHGKSRIPPVIYRRSPGIVHFAEKFSNLFGSWVYHELFGYVWKPAEFVFKEKRPFFDANYVTVEGELVLVPNQPWGWAPANLGTWFWSKKQGWIWIPGDAFSSSIYRVGLKNYPWDWLAEMMLPYWTDPFFTRTLLLDPYWNWLTTTPAFWIHQIYGNLDLYFLFREEGIKIWRQRYTQTFNRKPLHRKPENANIPENIKSIINRMNRVPLPRVKHYFSGTEALKSIQPVQIRQLNNRIKGEKLTTSVKEQLNRAAHGWKSHPHRMEISRIDWNPDAQWSRRLGIDIFYSTERNEVICPELKISSSTLRPFQKSHLKRSTITRSGPVSASAKGSPFNSNSTTTTSPTSGNTRQGHTSQTSGNSTNHGNGEKK